MVLLNRQTGIKYKVLLLLQISLAILVSVKAEEELSSDAPVISFNVDDLTDADIMILRNRLKLLDLYESDDDTLLALAAGLAGANDSV